MASSACSTCTTPAAVAEVGGRACGHRHVPRSQVRVRRTGGRAARAHHPVPGDRRRAAGGHHLAVAAQGLARGARARAHGADHLRHPRGVTRQRCFPEPVPPGFAGARGGTWPRLRAVLRTRRGDPAEQKRTLHALMVCALSTLLVFALLAMSTVPVLQAIGVTVTLGVISNFVLALLLTRERAARMMRYRSKLLPHAGSARMIERVVRWDAQEILAATTRHRSPDNPLRRDGRLACRAPGGIRGTGHGHSWRVVRYRRRTRAAARLARVGSRSRAEARLHRRPGRRAGDLGAGAVGATRELAILVHGESRRRSSLLRGRVAAMPRKV